jgi:hypothetical protein
MRIATWNMQGGGNTMYIPDVLGVTRADVLCLQECGGLYRVLHDRVPILRATGETDGYTGIYQTVGGDRFTVYWENEWTQGGVAVMTSLHHTAYGLLQPVGVPLGGGATWAPPNARWMPWVTVPVAAGTDIRIYSIHSVSGFTTADTCAWNNAQFGNIAAQAGAPPLWACVGDFNADPTAAGFVAPAGVGMRVVRSLRATHQNEKLLDYAVTNAPTLAPMAIVALGGAADHYPQVFDLP